MYIFEEEVIFYFGSDYTNILREINNGTFFYCECFYGSLWLFRFHGFKCFLYRKRSITNDEFQLRTEFVSFHQDHANQKMKHIFICIIVTIKNLKC